jgi:hypothetical protein
MWVGYIRTVEETKNIGQLRVRKDGKETEPYAGKWA